MMQARLSLPERARLDPDKPAVVIAHSEGEDRLSYAELDRRSADYARAFRQAGAEPGDHIALLCPNSVGMAAVVWAAERAGLQYTPISTHLQAAEIAYIVSNSRARVLVVDQSFADIATALIAETPGVESRFSLGGAIDRHRPLEQAAPSDGASDWGIDGPPGGVLFYSAGTTGRPKGVHRDHGQATVWSDPAFLPMYTDLYGVDDRTVWLSTGPLYHAGPLYGFLATLRAGGTVVVMGKYHAERALGLIEAYRVTHSQWVPTMFSRLLKLDPATRARYDLSSLRHALHGSAPCPISVKQAMIDWWGPVIIEFYGGTEGNGMTVITAQEWLAHKGSVGRPVYGTIHIVDGGVEVGPRSEGVIYFDSEIKFAYLNDADSTAGAHLANGWSTLDDIGFVDEEGYLYLTDRASFVIISGGVNIYPRETEDVLFDHPAVMDVAVIGVPHAEMGEEVKAVVELSPGFKGTLALEAELIAFCRARLGHIKCPRSIDFTADLDRNPTGKIEKRKLREKYWAGHANRLVVG